MNDSAHAALAEILHRDHAAFAEYVRRVAKMHRPSDDPRLKVCPLECDVSWPRRKFTRANCPLHCTNASCPNRRHDQPLVQWLRRHMREVEAYMPPHPPPAAGGRRLLLITTTYAHAEQLLRLRHCARALAGEPAVLWLVVEDAAERTAAWPRCWRAVVSSTSISRTGLRGMVATRSATRP